MGEVAAWIAPAATMIAATMVAANLGVRVTGWGFVVYGLGAIAWMVQAIVTQQPNLLWTNGFLLSVNVFGIYRWLFRRARFEQGAETATARSHAHDAPALFPISRLADAKVTGEGGEPIGQIVDAMAERESGRIAYVMLSEGGTAGVGERLHPVPWEEIRARDDGFTCRLPRGAIAALEEADARAWPGRAPRAAP